VKSSILNIDFDPAPPFPRQIWKLTGRAAADHDAAREAAYEAQMAKLTPEERAKCIPPEAAFLVDWIDREFDESST